MADIFRLDPEAAKAGAAHSRIQRAGGQQNVVANHLGLESARREAPQKSAAAIDGERLFARLARLPPGAGGQDQPVNPLERPAGRDQFRRQPVEQFRVSGEDSVHAEIVECRGEAGAEVVLPKPVDDHPRRERVVRGRDPLRQLESPLLLGRVGGQAKRAAKRADAVRPDFVPLGQRVATVQHMGHLRLAEGARVNRAPHRGMDFAQALLVTGQALGQLPDFCCLLAFQVGQQILELGLCPVAGRRPVGGAGNGPPLAGLRRDFKCVLDGQPIVVAAFAIARPFDAADGRRFGQLDLHPGVGAAVCDPAPRVPVPAVVDKRELVDRVAAVEVHAGGGCPGPGAGQRDIFALRENLEFINARLGSVGACDVEADKPGRHRLENFLIAPRVHRRLETRNPRLEQRQLFFCRVNPTLQGSLFHHESGIAFLVDHPFRVVHPGEDGLQRVVVALGHRVELVIVTTRAPQRQPEERGAGGVDHAVEFILPLHQREVDVLALDEIVRPRDEKAGAGAAAKGVAGQLPAHELVVRQVVIEGVHHPVAERPGVRSLPVGLESVSLGVANDIEPMLRPAFAEQGIVQHAINQPLPGVRLRIVDKCRNLPG